MHLTLCLDRRSQINDPKCVALPLKSCKFMAPHIKSEQNLVMIKKYNEY